MKLRLEAVQFVSPPDRPRPEAGSVHVWRVACAGSGPLRARAAEVLSPAERERAARFHHERDRERYLAGHLALRDILGRTLQLAPERLVFESGPHGKPALRDAPSVEFNLSVDARLSDMLRTGMRIYQMPEKIEERLRAFAERAL